MTREERIAILKDIIDGEIIHPQVRKDVGTWAIEALEQEPCNDVCEWFEQYVDIATDIVELRFSDGTVKRAKRGLYMRDIEKSIRKMLIDQIANEKKQEPEWIPVSERLPEKTGIYLISIGDLVTSKSFDGYNFRTESAVRFIPDAWMPLPEPYKTEMEVEE